MLLYVLESKGSSPGRQGFFMAVTQNGEMKGSIGGGVMEYKFTELAKERLSASSGEISVRKQIHDKSASKNQSGMICSGEQTILVYALKNRDIAFIESIILCIQQNKNGKLILSPTGINFEKQVPDRDFSYSFNSEFDWLYEEKLGYKNHLFIVGGGHCSLSFSKIMSDMDFYIRVFDNRKELNTLKQNDFVQEKIIVDDYSALTSLVPAGTNHYIIVMTFGYRTDDTAVRALLGKEFAFFGLLGSSAKISKMFAGYRNEGIEEQLLQRIHAPVGLSIHSQTPVEIAVSIAAQIIQVKNQQLSHSTQEIAIETKSAGG